MSTTGWQITCSKIFLLSACYRLLLIKILLSLVCSLCHMILFSNHSVSRALGNNTPVQPFRQLKSVITCRCVDILNLVSILFCVPCWHVSETHSVSTIDRSIVLYEEIEQLYWLGFFFERLDVEPLYWFMCKQRSRTVLFRKAMIEALFLGNQAPCHVLLFL